MSQMIYPPSTCIPKRRLMVTRKYAETYFEVISSALQLDYKGLGWVSSDLVTLSMGFCFCNKLNQLSLQENKITKLEPGCFKGLSG